MGRVLPILFNTDMVKAILEGEKTVTRRICKDANNYTVPDMDFYDAEKRTYAVHSYADAEHKQKLSIAERRCPVCPEDILYVRETWSEWTDGYVYKAWTEPFPQAGCYPTSTWHPSIHMPKEAARIWLRVTDVRVERLQEINGHGILQEGIDVGIYPDARCFDAVQEQAFQALWDSTVKKSDMSLYGWEANPWVWVIEFERCEKPEEK